MPDYDGPGGRVSPDDDNHPGYAHRTYHCRNCGEPVVAIAFSHGDDDTYPNGFCVGCSCTLMDSCPYEMSQAETPDNWVVPREDCCRGVDVSDLETLYGTDIADYRCDDCGATYRWDGKMVKFPDPPVTNDERPESALAGFDGTVQ